MMLFHLLIVVNFNFNSYLAGQFSPGMGMPGFHLKESLGMAETKDIYQSVTNQIIATLEQGTVPWIKPWRPGEPLVPINAYSGRSYSGINIPLLWSSAERRGFECDRWLTYRQAREAGGYIRKGEKASLAVLYCPIEKEELDNAGTPLPEQDGTPKVKRFAILKELKLFNIAQCEGLSGKLIVPIPTIENAIDVVKTIIRQSGIPVIHCRRDRAFYSPGKDQITMPYPDQFISSEHYYSTLLHELIHATGHCSRLERSGITTKGTFGDQTYAFEELVAEMGSAFLCAQLGVPGQLQHESYIASWLSVLRHDKRAIIKASGLARNACAYILEQVN